MRCVCYSSCRRRSIEGIQLKARRRYLWEEERKTLSACELRGSALVLNRLHHATIWVSLSSKFKWICGKSNWVTTKHNRHSHKSIKSIPILGFRHYSFTCTSNFSIPLNRVCGAYNTFRAISTLMSFNLVFDSFFSLVFLGKIIIIIIIIKNET